MSLEHESYANIRKFLGNFIGKKVIDISQHDEDHFVEHNETFIHFIFEDGSTIRFIDVPSFYYEDADDLDELGTMETNTDPDKP